MTGLERRNLEIKARDRDPARTARLCDELDGAASAGILRQRDVYFHAGAGRLKLREHVGSDAAELIYYERPSEDAVRTSRYWRTAVSDPEELAEILGLAHGIAGVVEKERRVFLWRNVRIHLDDVRGLGCFVELEVVHEGIDGNEADRPAIEHLMAALALDAGSLEPRGYLELLPHEALR